MIDTLNEIRDFLFFCFNQVVFLYATQFILSAVMAIFVLKKISKLIEKLR